jgi:hypothetical protein
MVIIKKDQEEKSGKSSEVTPALKTEGPLSEKDEQAIAIEAAPALQKEALKKWNALKSKA